MPHLQVTPKMELFYQEHDFTDPWKKSPAVLLLHGNAESSDAWYGWVPALARHLRVVRPDMRGFGSSTAMPSDFHWTLDIVIDDFIQLMNSLGIDKFHLVGAKIGGSIARAFAGRHPDRILTLTVVGSPPGLRSNVHSNIAARTEILQKHGVAYWAENTMMKRLGSSFPKEGAEWWTTFMGKTALSTEIGFVPLVAFADITADMKRIACPTLVITTDESGLVSVEQTRAWQRTILNSELLVLKGNSYHPALTHADECSHALLAFISRSTNYKSPA